MPLRKKEPFFNVREIVPMATKPKGGGELLVKGLSGRATKKITFFFTSLNFTYDFMAYSSLFLYESTCYPCFDKSVQSGQLNMAVFSGTLEKVTRPVCM